MNMINRFKLLAVAVMAAACSFLLPAAAPMLGAVAAYSVIAGVSDAQAATTNYNLGVPMVVIPVRIASAGASVTAAARFQMPFKSRLVGASVAARSGTGTTPTLTVDVLVSGVSILSAPVSATAGAVVEATIATSAIADEAALTLNLAVGGTTPLWTDVDVLLTFVRN